MTWGSPSAEEALHSAATPGPGVELSLGEGIVVSDLDVWSMRIAFSAPAEDVETWLSTAFDGAGGLPVTRGGATISQRFAPEEIHEGAGTSRARTRRIPPAPAQC